MSRLLSYVCLLCSYQSDAASNLRSHCRTNKHDKNKYIRGVTDDSEILQIVCKTSGVSSVVSENELFLDDGRRVDREVQNRIKRDIKYRSTNTPKKIVPSKQCYTHDFNVLDLPLQFQYSSSPPDCEQELYGSMRCIINGKVVYFSILRQNN